MERDALKLQLKEQIISYLNLIDMKPEDIADDALLFGEELGLDSIDSLELVVLLEREYDIKIESATEGRKILVDVNTIADYILEHKK
jgi:acyl carrier protein